MDLEQRVQALEQELQVLKNQIQATLLEIQEQLLTNAYPSLRAEDRVPAGSAAPAAQRPQPAADPAPVPAEPAAPVVRRVSLEDSKPGVPDAPPAHRAAPAARSNGAASGAFHDADLDALTRLEHWASDKVATMGVRRTRELIHMYAEKGQFSTEMRDALLHFVSLSVEDGVPAPPREEVTRPRRPAGMPPAQTIPPTQAPPPVQPQRAEPAQPQPRAKAQRGKPAAQPPAAPPQAAAPSVPAKPAAPPTPEPAAPPEAEPQDEQPANLVLKLIAGVANAGINPQKGKNKRG